MSAPHIVAYMTIPHENVYYCIHTHLHTDQDDSLRDDSKNTVWYLSHTHTHTHTHIQDDHEWYPGTVDEYDGSVRYHITYDDGENEWIELPSVDVCFSSEPQQTHSKGGENASRVCM